MKRILLILIIFYRLISSIQADEIINNQFSLAVQSGVYPDVVRYGEVAFIAVEAKNVGKDSIQIRSALRETGYSDCEIELYSDGKENCLLKWRNKDYFDEDEALPDARQDIGVHITVKEVLSGGRYIIAFRPVWIPPMHHEGNDFRTQLGNQLTRESLTFWIKSKFRLDSYLNFANEKLRQQKHELIFEFPDLKIVVNPTGENTYKTLRQWYQEIPGPYRWTDSVFFQLKDDDRDSKFYLPEHLSGRDRKKARYEINERLKRYQDYDQPEPRDKFIESRIDNANKLASELLKQPDTVISPHMKEFIVLRGLLVELRYADENELSRDKAFDKIVEWIKTSKFETTWVLVLKESGLPSIENVNHFPQQIVNNYIDKLSKIFPKEINATIDELNKEYNKEYKNILLNTPEPVNKTEQELLPSDSTSSLTASESLPNSDRRIDSTNPQQIQLEETSSWGFVTVLIVILFVLAIIGIIFVQKIFRNESKL